ncbi:zinc metallopeptidase [Lentisphaerota bacterium ZTH]|nr:zinc metallopeptidase [Lentisphaerota bacterium]WET06598.1 zinc metallopeptidase [Lentisphaerota bacterium ZTH]
MFFDPLYLIIALPGLLLAMFASFKTKSTFAKYSKVASRTGLTGAQAAQKLLNFCGISDVAIVETQGFLSDHYDPASRTLRLSPDVFRSNSLSAIGVACHEAGHAMQHARNYIPLYIRSALVPATNISTNISYFVLIAGMIFASSKLILLGAILFSAAVIFALVTLPVEWDASARAKRLMVSANIVSAQEAVHAGSVLNAAFLTYVAAAVSSLLTLLYYLLRSGVFGGSDD